MTTIRNRATLLSIILAAGAALTGGNALAQAVENPSTQLGVNPSTQPGVNDPAARFRGPLAYDFGITNVKWEAATPEYSYVTFDLYWSYSWRAKWTEPAATSATGKDMELENWDAAWVFVKFLPEKDSPEAKERNHWLHASLGKDPGNHVMCAGAMNSVKISEDGSRCMGVFIYRNSLGCGVNDFKGIKLRWNHSTDGVDPAKAAVRAYAIPMVYVPEGAFKLGVPQETGFTPFADGPDIPKTRFDGEQSLTQIPEGLRKVIEMTTSKDGGPYLRWTLKNQPFQFTDGGWRGGKAIPFLLDGEWNAPAATSPRSRRIGPVAGWFWSTHSFSERAGGATFGGPLGGAMALNDDCPTGYEAFYCMKYDVTQGQYCDYLNSLPPDVAAGRAWVSSEEWAMYGQRTTTIKERLPSGADIEVAEVAGNTIRSSADEPAGGAVAGGAENRMKDDMDLLLDDAMAERKKDGTKVKTGAATIPVYSARLPFRRLQGFCWDDIRAFCVWAGLRPMSALEAVKANVGARDPAAPPESASSYDTEGPLEMADDGLPTERPIKGLSTYGADYGVRVGCFATPTSDRAAARATYWGITELHARLTVPLLDKTFRGAHGNGTMPAGSPGAPWKRGFVAFTNTPPDWGHWDEYSGRRHAVKICRVVISAGNRILKPAGEGTASVFKRKPAAQYPPADAPRVDIPQVANVKLEPGKESSTVSFDLSWKNSWRAKWTEPAEKNVTGKPLTVESWDAAWVFVKFRPAGAGDEVPAMLAASSKDHQAPAGAELEVGLNGDGNRGVGVFIYRGAVGAGANDFRNVKLRWSHPPSPGSSGATSGADVDPTKGEIKVRAIAMVYVPEGPFASRSPWGHPLKTITDPDATKPQGHLDSGPESVPQFPEWPNGFPPFYCMKYSISQGEYADFLNSIPSRNYNGWRYDVLGNGNPKFYSGRYYNFNGYTIATNAAGVFAADVPNRSCNLLSLPDILGFIAWAGLRPPTNLEYEKACRGPRAVASGADAWTKATCAPAAGLDAAVLEAPSAVGPGPSYWGIRELSLSGCVQEWPAVLQNEPANPAMKQKGACVGFLGTHGSGSPSIPEDWPGTFFGDWYYGGIWRLWGYGTVGHWINADEYDGMPWETLDGERCGRYGARAVRTAVGAGAKASPLQLEDLPVLAGADVALVNLRGSFRNESDKPVKVALNTALPASSYLQGVASRNFTAAAKGETAFKVPVALTSLSANTAVRRGMFLPVQIEGVGGAVLAETTARLQMGVAKDKATVSQSLDGGKIGLTVRNATEKPVTLAVEIPSLPAVRIGETNRTLTVAAGADGAVAFTIPRQAFPKGGVCSVPYRVSAGDGAVVTGEAVVELRHQTRWWVMKRIQSGPKASGGTDAFRAGAGELAGLDEITGGESAVFKASSPPPGWKRASYGESLEFAGEDKLPSRDSAILAATLVEAPSEREVVVRQGKVEGQSRFRLRVWFNDALVFDRKPQPASARGAAPTTPPPSKPFRLRKGRNTLLVECQSLEDGPSIPGPVLLEFCDPQGFGKHTDLLFDMDAARGPAK